MHGKINKTSVDALKRGELLVDTEVKGFVARSLPSGTVTFGYRYRADGKRRWLPLGVHGEITADQARKKVLKRQGEVASDRDPLAEAQAKQTTRTCTVDALLDTYLDRYARKNLRSAGEVERCFKVCVRPALGSVSIYSLRRSQVVEMLDKIEDERGPVMADRTLAYLRKAFNWHATRDDAFVPPIVKGMARTKPKERERTRTLTDDEIRALWTALDTVELPSCYPAYVRALLLTGQRRDEVSELPWSEIDGDVWTIPASRYKTKRDHVVPLTPTVLSLMGSPRKRGFVFSTTDGEVPFSGFSKARSALDKHLPGMEHWTLHDLRRTARSLMSRAGVSSDIAERVLGHVIPGVRGVYDRHEYRAEKRDALERLASEIDRIINPPSADIISIVKARARNA